MLQFGAAVGDSIKIGDTVFLIGGRLLRIPGENALFSDIQPRVYIPMSYLDDTHLIQRGSRVTYTAFFHFPERDIQAIAKSIRPHTRGDRLRLETIESRKARLGRTLNNLYRFLNLGSFIALLLGGVGVASAIHTYTRQKLPTVAVLRSLGATARQTVLIYLIQAGGMGLIGSLIGALLGVGVLYLLPNVLADVLPLQVEPSFDFLAVLEGLGLGLGLSLLFAARPLLAIRKTSPLLTLRASFEDDQPADSGLLRWALYLGIILTIALFAYRLTDRWPLALGFVGGVGAAFALLTLTARSIIYGTRRFFPRLLELYLASGAGQSLPAQQPDHAADVGPRAGDFPTQHPLPDPDQPAVLHQKRRLRPKPQRRALRHPNRPAPRAELSRRRDGSATPATDAHRHHAHPQRQRPTRPHHTPRYH